MQPYIIDSQVVQVKCLLGCVQAHDDKADLSCRVNRNTTVAFPSTGIIEQGEISTVERSDH
jgi:hypothetical protein